MTSESPSTSELGAHRPTTSSKPTIAVIGSLNYDLVSRVSKLPQRGETLTSQSFSTNCGGKGANQAVAAARFASLCQDVRIEMIGAVGDDEFGGKLKEGLVEQGIDVDGVMVVSGTNSGVAVIVVEEDTGDNRIMISPGANASVTPNSLPPHLFQPNSSPDLIILQLEINLSTVTEIIQRASEAHIAIALNPAPAVPLPTSIYPLVDILIVNEIEAAALTGIGFDAAADSQEPMVAKAYDAIDGFLSLGCRCHIVVTLGSYGAVWRDSAGRGHVPANKVAKVVDTTGAGDTFVGAVAVCYVEAKAQGLPFNLEDAVRIASNAAAWSVAHQGTWKAMPLGRDLARGSS